MTDFRWRRCANYFANFGAPLRISRQNELRRLLKTMFLVIAYDISDDKRRSRVARELERWGDRTRFSVFECDLDEREEAEMTERIREILSKHDALRIYRLCEGCLDRCVIIGGRPPAEDREFYEV